MTNALSPVLVANRGEIAVRVIRTLRELGLESIAVYAEADRDTLACELATSAYSLGGRSAAETYLNPEAILEVAKKSGDFFRDGVLDLKTGINFQEVGVTVFDEELTGSDSHVAHGVEERAREVFEARVEFL